MGLFSKSNEKCKNSRAKSPAPCKIKERAKSPCIKKSKSPCRPKSPCIVKPPCYESVPVCESKCGTCACCKPGCSPRKPCVTCIKNGVKVQVIASKKCRRPCERGCCCCECPKKLTIKTRCEVIDDACPEVKEIECIPVKTCKFKEDDCPKVVECDNVVDYCKPPPKECKPLCIERKSSCPRNLQQCPCTSCKTICCNDKCEKKDNDDEKCVGSGSSCQKKRNSCKPLKQQDCVRRTPSCSKPCNIVDSCCTEKVDEACPVYEQGDCMSYFPIQEVNCCGSSMPSACLSSVGSFVVPQMSNRTPAPCPCGSRTCGNSLLLFH